ncbi:MAG: hypothetical protein K2M47_05880 [Clostridiales bacterium]|nr:hypothetical protein [Clostridiales bacterium]
MINSRLKKKILLPIVTFAFVLCLGIFTFLGISANSSNGGMLAGDSVTSNSGALNSAGDEEHPYRTYTYGQSYTIGGVDYTIGDGEKEYIDYKTALGLGDGYTVRLTSFTYPDGTVGTSDTNGVRNAGSYVFEVTGPARTNQVVTLAVDPQQIDYSTVDNIPVFVNATAPTYKAHGDITAIYKHNDGWYPSQKSGEVPVEIRTITNAYYYETGNAITIRMANEVLDDGYTSTTSTLAYDDNITIRITDRAGIQFTNPNEYIATFTFNVPNSNYVFTYGNAGDDDEITDKNKGLSITQRTDSSFVLSKHWFIAKYASLFVATDDTANYPFVPFHDNAKIEAAGGKTNISGSKVEGENGETNTATDAVTYTDVFTVKTPVAKFNSGLYDASDKEIIKDGTVKFDVIYVDLDGKTHRVANQVTLDATGSVAQNTITYYFNQTMPAGNYTLKLYGEIAQSEMAAGLPNKIQGEYWLTVLPKEIDSTLVNDVQNAIRGDLDGLADSDASGIDKYVNIYALGDNMLHRDLSEEISALNSMLNNTLNGMAGQSYWSDLSATDQKQYFDTAVTVMYNRNTWSASNYVTEQDMIGMLSSSGTYTMYYSISAKNYITVGGADSANRTDYGFRTRLSTGLSVKEIYDMIVNPSNSYFKDVVYTGEQVHTLVPDNQYYGYSFDDKTSEGELNYVNVREKASVTLTVYDPNLMSWKNDLPDSVTLGDYFELSDDHQRLTVYFDIIPATNGWTVAPQMSPWAYNDFKASVNFISAGLAFGGAEVYYRLGTKKADNTYEWVSMDGTLMVNGELAPEYFTVDANGMINDETVVQKINDLSAGTYYLGGYINPIYNVNGYVMPDQACSAVVVMQATNTWTATPYVLDWAYNSFNSANFQAGEATFGEKSDITYTLYEGNNASGTVKATFNSISDDGVVDTLNGLNVATYTLVASLSGTSDYSALNLPLIFVVYKANNAWTTTPFINSWAYKQFTANNVRAGAAQFGSQITYYLYEGDAATDTPLYTFNSLSDTVNVDGNDVSVSEMFVDLPAKIYTLVASVADTDNYGGVSMTITFAVTKASNTWTTTPVMTGWAYKLFSTSNFQAGVTEFGEQSTIDYKLYVGNPEDITSETVAELEFKTINDSGVIDYFKALSKGTYTLVASQIGADDYGELNRSMTFSVTQATNTWTTMPYITGWTYSQFNTNNFQAGATEFGDNSKITYKLYIGDPEDITNETVAELEFKSINETGVIDYFKALAKGTYTLVASQEGTESYGALNTPMTFAVTQAANRWTTTPYITGWTYNGFTDTNFNAGVAQFGDSSKITYTLYEGSNASGTVKATFNSISDDGIFDTLNGLPVNTYTLVASLTVTDEESYGDLNTPITFTVSPVNNTWNQQPTITGFVYKQFSTENNFIAGVPHYPLENKTVYYVISGSAVGEVKTLAAFQAVNGEHFTLSDSATLGAATVNYLTNLSKGAYYFAVFVPEANNYSYLFYAGSFNVSQTNNYWVNATPPDIRGWTYGMFTDSLFTTGTPIHGTAMYTVRYVVDGNVDETENGIVKIGNVALENMSYAELKAVINGLNAGTYSLQATSGYTDDYAEAKASKQFVVAKADNEWENAPSIEGWVYGQYDNDTNKVNVGKAQHGTGIEYTYKYYAAVNENGIFVATGSAISANDIKTANAGNYVLVVTADGDNNYNVLVYTVNFVVERKALGWQTEPNDRLDWNRGSTDGLNDSTLVNASVQGVTSYTLTYTIYKIDETETSQINEISVNVNGATRNVDNLIAALRALGVGAYRITVKATVNATGNYETLEKNVSCTVSLAINEWVTELNGATWTWGNHATALNALNTPNADYGNDTIVFTVKNGATTVQTIRAVDNDLDTAFSTLKTYLGGLNVGTYSVTVSIAATDSYAAPQSTTAEFTVNIVTTVWDAATAANNNTEYNGVVGSSITVAQPVIGTPAAQRGSWGSTVDYKLVKGEQELYSGNTWSSLITALNNCKAGEYTITAHIDGDTNHTALDYSVIVNISAKANSWSEKTGNGNSTAKEIEKTYGADLSFIKFTPAHGTVVVTVNGKATNDVIGYINSYGVGEYLIVATVAGTDEYGVLVDTVRLTIIKAENEWNNNLSISDWTWNDNANNIVTDLVLPVSTQGESASVVVTVKQTGAVVLEATINYVRVGGVRKVSDNDLAALDSRLKALGVVTGGYTIAVTVSETDSYNSLDGQSADFVITKATNSWTANGKPKVESWSFGGDTAYPSADPTFGKNTVVFTYAAPSDNDIFQDGERVAPAPDAVWQNAPSYQAGSYWLKAYVPATDNYSELVDYYLFTIKEGKNEWVNMPGVIEWSWNGYDAAVNLFSGSARSNQPAVFSITKANKNDLELTDFNASYAQGVTITTQTIALLKSFTLSKNDSNLMVVSDDVAKLLKALKPATYTLTVTVDGGESLESLTGSTTFTVAKAENGWATDETGKSLAPSVRYYNYGESNVFEQGVALYGTTVNYQITNTSYGVITDVEVLKARLKALPAGSYFLNAWVDAANEYRGLYSAVTPYQTQFVVSAVANSWAENGEPKESVSEYYAVIHGSGFDVEAWLGQPQAENGAGTEGYTIMTVGYSALNATPYTYAQYVNAVKALNAGEYIVRISVPATINYLALTQDMSLTISKYNSKFTAIPQKLTGKWQQDADKKTSTVLDDVTIKAYSYITVGGTDTNVAELPVQYILAGVTYNSFAALKNAVKLLGRGSYQVTVFVTQTESYEGLSATLQLDIAAGDNTWVTDTNVPAPEQSLVVKGDDEKSPVTQWAWSTEIDWLGVKPLYGDTVVIRIVSKSDESNVLKYFTVNSGDGFDTQRELVSTYISKLDVGTYIMIITTPSGDNWNGIDDTVSSSGPSVSQDGNDAVTTRVQFTIVEAINDWKAEDTAPHFSGNNVIYEGGMYKWVYGTAVTAVAEARFGTVRVAYYTADGDALTVMPTSAGTYKAVFSVAKPSTGNYTAIDGERAVTLNFTVEGVVYEAFDVSLRASGWVWNTYDRTVNLFRGKPTSGGKVHYEVLDASGAVIVDKFDLVDADGKHYNNYDKDVYVPVAVADKLKALTKGTYTLRVYVDAKDNYEAFDAETTFDVTEATNTWVVTPKIASWFRGGWLESKNSPVAVSLYGEPVVVITSNASGETLYRAVYDETTGEYIVSLNLLEPADAGWYTMSVSVDGCAGMYTALPTTEVEFQIFIQGSPDDKNFWEVTPGIEGWTATIDGKVTMPTGKPVRGKPYFVFYRAELDGDEYKLVEKVVAGEDAVTVKKGENYAQDFYIPMAPGTYFMYAYALNAAVPSDALDEDDSSRVMLVIRNRANSWEKSVSISSLLYLGERDNWADPVAIASLPDSGITYKYLDAETRAYLGTEIPTEVGKYIVVAYATNRYSQTIESEMEFQVLLSKNYWVDDTSPTIENWTEENSAKSPNPVGAAAFGTIVYTYASKANPNKVLTKKPTAAGDYIMTARVELDGYETLEAHYSFTIEPAFDSTLVLINIILGVIAIAVAVVVIYFAIRRYKEN